MTPDEQRERYYNSKGGCLLATIKLMAFTVLLLISSTLFAQPIKSQFDMGIKTYQPPVYVNTNTAVPGPRGPKGYDGKSQVIHTIDTFKVTPDLSQYMRKDDFQDILERNITNVYNQQADISTIVRQVDEYYADKMKFMEYNLNAHQLKNAGTFKILSGVGLQAVALGLVAYAQVDIVENANVYMSYPIGYTTKEYNLIEDKQTIHLITDRHPWPSIDVDIDRYRYTMTSKDVDKVTHVAVNDNFPCITERNKGVYYTAAGVLAGTGVVLEVLGIIDLHNAHVLINHNSMGVKLTF